MKPIPEKVVAEVVGEVAKKLSDPQFTETTVGEFVHKQGRLTQYLSAKASKVGGAEGVVQVIFHAATLLRCAERHVGRHLMVIGFDVLDNVAALDTEKELAKRQPAFGEYIVSNVDNLEARRGLFLVALAIDAVL